MEADDYGKITYMIMNQEGMTAQSRLDLIYKTSLLMVDMQRYNPENLKVVLTQEKTVVETPSQDTDFSSRIHGKDDVQQTS